MVVMGRVSAPHGVKGWIKVQPFTQNVNGLLDYPRWWLGMGGEWRVHRVTEVAMNGATVIASLDGLADREAAAAVKGAQVAVPRALLPGNRAGEYYWSDLLGMNVVNVRNEPLGQVAKLLDTGPHTVLVLQGEKELLIPFVEAVIRDVDVDGRQIVADWELDY